MDELYKDKEWRIVRESVQLPNGKVKNVSRAQRPNSVHIIAFLRPDTVLLLREYRPYYGQYLWMLPSGRIDKEADKEVAAQRELREETGYRADALQYLFDGNASESVIMTNYFFRATGLTKDPLPQDDDELIEVHELPLTKALENILHSPIVHTTSAYGLMRYMHEHHTK